jgi:hypothetical protein
MRTFRLLFTCALAFACLAPLRADATPPHSLDVSGDRVAYFSNRFIVTADGNVRVRLSDGTIVRGETFTMDLKLNRYLVAGNVTVDSGPVHDTGAAFAGYPDLDRSYFIPSTPVPDRWTFFGSDWGKPVKGRQQPGDAFYFPDLSAEKPFIKSSSVMVIPKTLVRFKNANLYVFGVYVPVLSYAVVFSGNPNYQQNGFAGANADVGVPFNASEHATTAVHARYDSVNHLYFSYDQHFVWDKDYIVASVNPATTIHKQWNLIGFKQLSPDVQMHLFQQVSTDGAAFAEPWGSGGLTNISAAVYSPHLQLAFAANFDQFNASYLGNRIWVQEMYHPSDGVLSVTGLEHHLKLVPLTVKFRAGYGYAHDGYVCGLGAPCAAVAGQAPPGSYLLNFNGIPVTTETYNFEGVTAYTPSIKVKRVDVSLNATFDKQRTYYSLPHHVDVTNTAFSLSKLYGRKLALVAAYAISNTGDFFGAQQLTFYPPSGPIGSPYTGQTYDDFETFRGFSTTHTVSESAVITPTPYFNLNLTLSEPKSFPGNIPGVYGSPTLQLSADLRVRLAKQISMDLSRAYYFNYFTATWTPNFGISFGP